MFQAYVTAVNVGGSVGGDVGGTCGGIGVRAAHKSIGLASHGNGAGVVVSTYLQ